jgi:hypothetical protein
LSEPRRSGARIILDGWSQMKTLPDLDRSRGGLDPAGATVCQRLSSAASGPAGSMLPAWRRDDDQGPRALCITAPGLAAQPSLMAGLPPSKKSSRGGAKKSITSVSLAAIARLRISRPTEPRAHQPGVGKPLSFLVGVVLGMTR